MMEGGGSSAEYSHIVASLSLVGVRLRTWATVFVHDRLRTWAVVFVRGQLSGRSFPFVSRCLRTRAVGGRTRPDGRRYRCRCGRGHMLVAPAFGVKRRKREGDYDDSPAYADGDDGRHRHHLDDVARCHVVACTLHHLSVQPLGTADVALRPRFRRGWRLPWLWATSDGGGR